MRKLSITLIMLLSFTQLAIANTGELHPKKLKWKFEGVFGTFDVQAIQRGYQVYKEVCSACHSLNLVAYRNLKEIGFSDKEIETLAAEHTVPDTDDAGSPIERKALPSDHFVPPFANEKAARAANNGAYPPDQSLIIKARHDGANYIHSLLTGYSNPPQGVVIPEGKHYNAYFPGGMIAMPPPLQEGQVTYQDGTKATVDQMARDVVHFLHWAAEPEMQRRKAMGIKVLLYLSVFTIMFYITKRKIWSKLP
jgi:ubiquinol-cytochrome c reductase cytochrome c1 subunit